MSDQKEIQNPFFSAKNPYHILVVDRRRRTAAGLRKELGNTVRIDHATTADTALQQMGLMKFDLIILQLKLSLFRGVDFARHIKKILPNQTLLSLCPSSMTEDAQNIVELGYPAPLMPDQDSISEIAAVCLETIYSEAWYRQIESIKENLQKQYHFNQMLSLTPEIQDIYEKLSRVSESVVPILITGESGTGKELIARMIHSTGNRLDKPFISVNCAAIPEGLLESQFFGHEKGAFTGADSRMPGKFELADTGTLFLDEISELSINLQAKFLRIIEYGAFERVGGVETLHVDVRLITASNQNLEESVAEGNFRSDLFYRINVFPIHLPPLRERGDDVLMLAYHFLRQTGERNNRRINVIHHDARDLLGCYPWQGNVRELENAIERAVLLSDGVRLNASDFPNQLEWLQRQSNGEAAETISPEGISEDEEVLTLKDIEREAIRQALQRTSWNIAKTSQQLGIGRSTLYRKIEEHGLDNIKD
ncbi:sigma-54-dependent Fis family transcriptional regulator [bacterium]|nr:sigma-54-dependent Fis family transcriptional regulator [bacterium]